VSNVDIFRQFTMHACAALQRYRTGIQRQLHAAAV